MVLLLTESDVTSLLDMETVLKVVEDALRDLGEGSAQNHARYRLASLSTILSVMSGSLPRIRSSGLKVYVSSREKTRFLALLVDAESGEWLSIMAANKLGQMRTGAASGVATKYLARKDAATLGIFGSGWQARSQVEAISKVRGLERINCYSRNHKNAETFATEIERLLGLKCFPIKESNATVKDADIIVTCTSSREPVLLGEYVENGVHINGVGANEIRRREMDSTAIAKCDKIFVDSLEQSKIESGDLTGPVSEGVLEWSKVKEIGSLLTGKCQGRTDSNQITLFKSNGIAIEDVAVARHVYELALSRGVGREVELFK